MTHREVIKDYLRAIVYKNKFIIDWGSGSKPVSRYIQSENCKFITIDQNKLIASDRRSNIHFTHDIQEPIDLGKADVAFCMEVLEHTLNPKKILANVYKNLKDGGTFYISVPFLYPIHSEDDYLRYTDTGIKALLTEQGFKVELIMSTVEDLGWIVKATK